MSTHYDTTRPAGAEDVVKTVSSFVADLAQIPHDDVGESTLLSAVGIDSLGLLELQFKCEQAFGITVPPGRMSTSDMSIGAIAALIAAERQN